MRTDPNTHDKNILYDLNLNNPSTKATKQFKNSLHIGDALGRLHDSEMDFADHYAKIGGFLIGQSEVTIKWYLMKARHIPLGSCSLDHLCLVKKETASGFVDFDNQPLKENGIFYICAVVTKTNNRTGQSSHICSDGFLIDESLPEEGVVAIQSENGYLIDGSEITLRWSGFHDNRKAEIIGYPSDIAYYQFAIGKFIIC
jgi:hypothetical protein